jgi:predicted outer membrane repeat protein
MEKTIPLTSTTKRIRRIFLSIFFSIFLVVAHAQVIYVHLSATGNNNGSSWQHAYTSITAAVARANSDAAVKEIRISGGLYQESELFLTGRYTLSGYWNSATDARDVSMPTIIDGQLQHRIMTVEADAQVKISWVDFTRGGVTGDIQFNGGGIHNKGYLALDHCSVTGCSIPYTPFGGTGDGGGVLNTGNMELSNTSFENNESGQSAGALANFGSITISSCTFNNNVTKYWGGAINNTGRMKLFRSRFTNNSIHFQGGGLVVNGQGGAIANRSGNTGSANIVNCIFDKNKALTGGAIAAGYNANIVNNTFYANEAYLATQVKGFGGAVYIPYGAITTVFNNIFSANLSWLNASVYSDGASSSMPLAQIKYNLAEPGNIVVNNLNSATADVANNIFSVPLFIDPENGNFNMLPVSLALNAGNNEYYSGRGFPGVDYQGLLRVSPCNIDIGAIEFQYPNLNLIWPDNNGILYVNRSSTYNGASQGSSWENALNSLKLAIDFANLCASITEIRVAGGLYKEADLSIYRGYDIRGGFNASTGEQNWAHHLTLLESSVNGRVFYTKASAGSIRIEGCWFRAGKGVNEGGAILNESNLQISNCRFLFNQANSGGAVFHRNGTLHIINTEFIENTANAGGAIYAESAVSVTNCSFNNNTATTAGDAIYNNNGARSNLSNNIIWGNGLTQVSNAGELRLDRNIIRGSIGGTVNMATNAATDMMNVDPLFWGATELSLQSGSPAINKGNNESYEYADADPANSSVVNSRDNSYYTRVYDSIIDLGASERQMKQQVITVADKSAVYGDPPLDPAAIASSALPVVLQSQDNTIAEAFTDTDGISKLRIRKKGVVNINAHQSGNGVYDAAPVSTFTLTVDPKPVTVTANTLSKTYGEADPVLSYTVLPALVAGDAFTGTISRVAGEDAGIYAIEQGGLSLSENYLLTYTGADFTINKKQITVTAGPGSKTYGDADPALSYTYSPALAFTDAFSNTLTRAAGENAGTYAIQQGTLSLNTNYDIVFAGNDFVIQKMNIAVTAETRSKIYGEADPSFTYTTSPALINGDVLTGSLARTPGEQAGAYPIESGTLDHQNYAISFTGAQFTINQATQQISWNQALVSDCNGGSTLTLNAGTNSGLPVTYQSSNTAVASVNGNQLTFVSPGHATITAIQTGNVNYLPATNVQLDLTSRLPAHLIKKHWEDVLFFDNSSKQYTSWQWYKNDQPVSNATGQYFYESGKLNGEYYAAGKTNTGTVLPTCPVTITPVVAIYPVSVVPNPVRAGQQVTVKISFTQAELAGASISLLNVQGTELGLIQNVLPSTTITMPAFAGIYIVKLRLASGATYSTNVLVKP